MNYQRFQREQWMIVALAVLLLVASSLDYHWQREDARHPVPPITQVAVTK